MAVKKETPSKNLLDTIPGKINWIWPVIKSRHNYIRPPEKAEELRLAYEAAEKANHAKSVFLANMSHEMRTPLNAILGITEIQLQNKTITPELREALNKIYNSGDLLLGIINDILDLSKIEAGKFELSEAPYQVASLIHDSAALNMMHCKDKPIQFKLSIDKDIPAVLAGDELRIKEILNNLLSNAFKYTRKGAITLSVSVQAETNDGDNTVDGREAARDREADKNSFITLVFSVSDTGLGMTEDQIGKLYDEYTRFNNSVNNGIEGIGLGMSITRNLIHLMNGTISVTSKINQGTVFTVHLPQKVVSSGVLGTKVAESLQNFEINEAKRVGKSKIVYETMPYGRVLLVDDVETNLYVAKGLLAPYGMFIDTARSGFEAIEKIKDGKTYDIVFMDHMMPKMDGIEATKKIRKTGYTKAIIALTANAITGQADTFLANGFDGFISKPIDMRQLDTILKQFIRDRHYPKTIEAPSAQTHVDPEIAELFLQDVSGAVKTLEKIQKKSRVLNNADIQAYVTSIHGMKSALVNIGERDLSEAAALLEQKGRDKDIAGMKKEIPAFLNELQAITGKIAGLYGKNCA